MIGEIPISDACHYMDAHDTETLTNYIHHGFRRGFRCRPMYLVFTTPIFLSEPSDHDVGPRRLRRRLRHRQAHKRQAPIALVIVVVIIVVVVTDDDERGVVVVVVVVADDEDKKLPRRIRRRRPLLLLLAVLASHLPDHFADIAIALVAVDTGGRTHRVARRRRFRQRRGRRRRLVVVVVVVVVLLLRAVRVSSDLRLVVQGAAVVAVRDAPRGPSAFPPRGIRVVPDGRRRADDAVLVAPPRGQGGLGRWWRRVYDDDVVVVVVVVVVVAPASSVADEE